MKFVVLVFMFFLIVLSGELLVEHSSKNGLVHFKLNRPERFNALSLSQVQTIGPYVDELANNAAECQAILLTGEGAMELKETKFICVGKTKLQHTYSKHFLF